MKRFSDHCHGCFCPSYTLPDNCKCNCHDSLRHMMKVTGMTIDEIKIECNRIKNKIENNPLAEFQYDAWKIRHGKYVNKETAKYK